MAREPLVRFMLLGALIFAAAHVVAAGRSRTPRRIVIDPQVVQRLTAVSQMQDGVTPGRTELAALVNQYVEDEALYREALRRGLDRDDEIVRRRLIQKMRYIEHDLAVPAAPDREVLLAYYASHASLFSSPGRAAFEEIYFSPDRDGWQGARARAVRARLHLVTQPNGSAGRWLARQQDEFPAQLPAGELTRDEAARLFGASAVASALFDGALDEWSQPVRSGYGWHLIRVTHRTPARAPAFAQVRAEVQAAWTEEEARKRERRELDALRARYEVVHVGLQTTGVK